MTQDLSMKRILRKLANCVVMNFEWDNSKHGQACSNVYFEDGTCSSVIDIFEHNMNSVFTDIWFHPQESFGWI